MIDPICGMEVEPNTAAGCHVHDGQTYYFCSHHCVAKFKENPALYVKPATRPHAAGLEQPAAADKSIITDPICGMTVDPKSAAGKHEHNGQTYYFCSQHCLAKFKEDPEKWLGVQRGGHIAPSLQTPTTAKPDDGSYVCPMDPEVRESKPGACPKCGMALEPATFSAPL